MSGLVHPDQNVRNATQNSLCRAVNRRRGCCACRASNCRRRARFSRTRSSRERKALTNQPRKCRSDTIMARIVAEKSESSFSQVIHSAGVRRFGEAVVDKYGRVYVNFSPGVSREALKKMRQTVRGWHIQLMCDQELNDLSNMFGPILRGWANYYGRFYPTALKPLWRQVNDLSGALDAAEI
jgi:Group II intron, maturase-specific domain